MTDNNRPRKRILLVDDHPLLREGIAQLVNGQPDLEVCAEAENRAEAMAAFAKHRPDLAVVDLALKEQSGLELLKDLKARFPRLAVLVLSMHDEKLYAERVLRAGARGYIMKREASKNVLEAIRRILDGGVYVSNAVAANILDKASGRPAAARQAELHPLSDREVEVLLAIGQGFSSRQIADRLCISVKTVEAHRANIKLKLRLPSGGELLRFAIHWARETDTE